VSGEVRIFTTLDFCRTAALVGEWYVIHPSVTPNSSLSFEARELKFCVQTSHIIAKKVSTGI